MSARMGEDADLAAARETVIAAARAIANECVWEFEERGQWNPPSNGAVNALVDALAALDALATKEEECRCVRRWEGTESRMDVTGCPLHTIPYLMDEDRPAPPRAGSETFFFQGGNYD